MLGSGYLAVKSLRDAERKKENEKIKTMEKSIIIVIFPSYAVALSG